MLCFHFIHFEIVTLVFISSLTHRLLEVCYSVLKYLGNFPDIFLLLISEFNFIMVRKHILYDLNLLKLIEPCFMTQNMVYLGKCPMHTQKECIMLLLGEVIYKYQLGKVNSFVQVFYIFSDFCVLVIKRMV